MRAGIDPAHLLGLFIKETNYHKIKKGAKRTLLLLVVYLELYPLSRTSALLIRSNSTTNIQLFFYLPKYLLIIYQKKPKKTKKPWCKKYSICTKSQFLNQKYSILHQVSIFLVQNNETKTCSG